MFKYNDINILSSKYSNFNESYVSKSKFGGFSKSMSLDDASSTTLKSSVLESKDGDISLNSNKNILLSSANIKTPINIFLNAKESVFINSGEEITSQRSISKKSSFNPFNLIVSVASLGIIDRPIYTQNIHKGLNSKITQKVSNLKSGKDISILSLIHI